eukprot:COSAG01_NODE_67643_length_266_cov_0.928144_1_plen_50_part_10
MTAARVSALLPYQHHEMMVCIDYSYAIGHTPQPWKAAPPPHDLCCFSWPG